MSPGGVEHIAWPGPRPIEDGRLVGRRKARQDLLDACRSNLVVVITAPSGVGKTSFINSAVPHLERNDYRVDRAGPWDVTLTRFDEVVSDAGTAESAQAELLYDVALTEARARAAAAEETRERDLVVVFDQVEELLRYRRALGAAFLEFVSATARRTGSTHVVIARSEFRDQLRPLERDAVPWPLRLQEISEPNTIAEIIALPADDAGVVIEPGAVLRLYRWWEAARKAPESRTNEGGLLREAVFDVGLLHLQALLWSFKQWAVESDDIGPQARSLTDAHLMEFARSALGEDGDDPADAATGAQLIEGAILRYVKDTIDKATSAAMVARMDPPVRWPNGPRLMLARVAPYLSSAGYKIPQALSSLIPVALAEEFPADQLRELRSFARRRVSRESIAEAYPLEPAGIALHWAPDRADKSKRRGWVTLEMINALEAGLRALASDEVNILKRFAPGEADPIYDLVHDGLGSALNKWAEDVLNDPIAVVGVIAARAGLAMEHSLSPENFRDDGVVGPDWGAVALRDAPGASADGQVVVLSGLRWVGSVTGASHLTTTLEDLVFDGCDLTGAVFIRVNFRNVTFADCKLGGVAMLFCTLDGVAFEASSDDTGQLDTLTVDSPEPGANVTFDVTNTRGLFLVGLSGGTWSFRGDELSHLVITANDEPLDLEFDVADLSHVTVETGSSTTITSVHVPDHVTTSPDGLFDGAGS